MKKIWWMVLALALLLTGCGKQNKVQGASFCGVIEELSKTSAVVLVAEGEEERSSADRISFGIAELKSIGAKVGDTVEVHYTGVIMETYPAQVVATGWEMVKKALEPLEIPEEQTAEETEPITLETDDKENSFPGDVPPVLVVVSGKTEYQIMSGDYTWTSDVLDDGTQQSVIACGPHPLQMEPPEDILSVEAGALIELHFDVQPEQITCRCWEEQYWNDETSFEANYEIVTVENGCIAPPSQLRYVYEVDAIWNEGCQASYVFFAVTDAVPSAE